MDKAISIFCLTLCLTLESLGCELCSNVVMAGFFCVFLVNKHIFCHFPGMPPGAAGPPGYPPNSNYGGYPPPPHSRPDSYPPGAYPPGHPSSYPPPQRMGWPPHQQPPGYGPPPSNGGPPPTTGAPPGPPGSYTQNYYGPPRPGYTPPASSATGPPTTVTASGGPPGGPPNHSPYGPQPPYQDQYQV